jgi:BioD-like phosphotransacetylase family protein
MILERFLPPRKDRAIEIAFPPINTFDDVLNAIGFIVNAAGQVKEQLMDRMDRTELAANQFRKTQTREKLKREGIKNQRDAIEAHETVGKEVRAAIAKIGGTPPENIPPAEHIKKVEKRLKKLDQSCFFMRRIRDCSHKILSKILSDFHAETIIVHIT